MTAMACVQDAGSASQEGTVPVPVIRLARRRQASPAYRLRAGRPGTAPVRHLTWYRLPSLARHRQSVGAFDVLRYRAVSSGNARVTAAVRLDTCSRP
jgi:hypothetical protein